MKYKFRVVETKKIISEIEVEADSIWLAEGIVVDWSSADGNEENLIVLDQRRDSDFELEEM